MTDKQLEKLIKQGGIVGNIDEHIAIKLDPDIHTIFYPSDYSSERLYEKDLTLGKSVYKCRVSDLEKISKKDFDKITWCNKTHAKRTERFEPPMWEDILIGYMFWFCDNSRKQSILIKFHLSKLSNITIERSDAIGVPIFDEPATKENYEKACEIVRDLFKGEQQ